MSEQSETPRTDKAKKIFGDHWNYDTAVPVEDCEEIERDLNAARAELAKANQLIYMPGDWKCDVCGFMQHNRTLHTVTGDVSAPKIEEVQICPNKDGSIMRRVTWREGSEANYEAAIKAMQEAKGLREQLSKWKALAEKLGESLRRCPQECGTIDHRPGEYHLIGERCEPIERLVAALVELDWLRGAQ